ncbi:auxilin-related protein 2 [Manihot esculenta]|uniref:J domain-containing protein n=1 Tax=Manihot esculenta TaxID=3983 RepID=A0A2C9UU55_MANES|nr:auxilin-related protein 2 [Manihot esculenta]XP_021629733.1 auxilin-related protein 2 [Manihot esculenta]OAY34932.1 hypothetical protein MANES_12G058900v8 [Manihot esculenta]
MDDFPGLLAQDLGFKPQGKSAPMAPSRNSNTNTFSSLNFGIGSTAPAHSRSSSGANKSAPVFDDHDYDRGKSDGLLFNDVFGGPPKYAESRGGGDGRINSSSSAFGYDSIFKDQNAKYSSLPVYDKPVYDDDIFDGLPGLKSSSVGPQSAKFDDVFSSIGPASSTKLRAQSNSSPFDDLLGNLGKKETESKRETPKVDKDSATFDDLLPGFGRSSSPSISRSTSESSRSQKPSSDSSRTASSMMEDPFVVLESTSTHATSSSRLHVDPLEEIGKFSSSGNTKVDNSSVNMGVFDDMDSFDNLGKSVPPVSPGVNRRGKDRSPIRTGSSMGGTYSSAHEEPVDENPVDEAEGRSQKKIPKDDFQESHETLFDMPRVGQNVSSPSYVNASSNGVSSPPRYEDIATSPDDVWLTVSEVPLFTQPTSAPPPSRPPPPRPPRFPKSETGSFSSRNSRKKVNEYSTSYSESPRSAYAARSSAASQIDELEDFAMGRTRSNVSEHADVLYGEDVDANASSAAASAAAMKEAMDKAEAKFRQMREREYLKAARSRETGQLDKEMLEAQHRELKERQERQQREREEEEREQRRLEKEREREEKEREQRRLERERERAREIEREREKARQAVERATREARERAAVEARLRAERAAVEKVSAEARERAERAAVQRAQAEARERAAADARERAEKAAAEARERANAEARERAAVARAEADARQRAERAAVERAAAEARERAAAEARERAAAAARANQQKTDNQQRNDNDLESFFSSRASSAPRPRATSSDPFFDTQSKGGSEAAKRTSVGAVSSMKKASSVANIDDDLSSIFGAPATSGEFQQVEGETEERRRARWERHQRTQERAAKALAEKNQRDLQAQMEQAERHRIAETLDVEIKRWAAGKEGNLRALLSTLQYVLWPECGWQPVSLTDLITAAAVKKVYRKATLCIHPDKVQQKGANLQQKYIAEKVFDLLKEAWNKFNSEELF